MEQKVEWKGQQVKTGNRGLAEFLAKWVTQKEGALKLENPRHHHVNQTQQHGIYRIKDDLVFEVDVYQRDPKDSSKWIPASLKDAQFEVIMLDPYIRMPLSPPASSKSPTHSARFTLPDHYGVFTFKFEYTRRGVSYLHHSETVQVKPFRHDQYPRYLTAAYPYYVASYTMMAGFFVLSAVLLFHRDTSVKLKTT